HPPARPGRALLPPGRHPAPRPAGRARHARRTARAAGAGRLARGRVLPGCRPGRGAARWAARGAGVSFAPPRTGRVLLLLAGAALRRLFRATRLVRARARQGQRGPTRRKGGGGLVVLMLAMLPLLGFQALVISSQAVTSLAAATADDAHPGGDPAVAAAARRFRERTATAEGVILVAPLSPGSRRAPD